MPKIKEVIESRQRSLGGGFTVRRVLPSTEKSMVGPFIFWDHMGPVALETGEEIQVRAHPHIGLATVTYLFSGEIMHRDSLGNEQAIRPGEVNWMTAGKGIVHSERSYLAPGVTELEGIQLWVALPKESEEVAPNFTHMKESLLPMITKGNASFRLIAGQAMGEKSPLPTYSPLFYLVGDLVADAELSLALKADEEGAVYVARGEISVNDQVYGEGTMVCFQQGEPIEFRSNAPAIVMVLGGQVFSEPRHLWWNFVSSDLGRMEKAKQDWKDGRFPSVINESERIPLPEK